MAIVTKKIGGREYAYASTRDGKRIITRYIGPAGSPEVLRAIDESKSSTAVPQKFKTLFWDTDIKNINLRSNSRYVIERVLEHGDLEALNWIGRVYTVRKILDVLDTGRAISEKSRILWRLWFEAEVA